MGKQKIPVTKSIQVCTRLLDSSLPQASSKTLSEAKPSLQDPHTW